MRGHAPKRRDEHQVVPAGDSHYDQDGPSIWPCLHDEVTVTCATTRSQRSARCERVVATVTDRFVCPRCQTISYSHDGLVEGRCERSEGRLPNTPQRL